MGKRELLELWYIFVLQCRLSKTVDFLCIAVKKRKKNLSFFCFFHYSTLVLESLLYEPTV